MYSCMLTPACLAAAAMAARCAGSGNRRLIALGSDMVSTVSAIPATCLGTDTPPAQPGCLPPTGAGASDALAQAGIYRGSPAATGQDRTGQDRTGQDRTGQDRTGRGGSRSA